MVYAMKLSPEKTMDVSRPHQLKSSPHLSHTLLSVTRDSGVWSGILDKCNHAAFWPLSEFSGNPSGWGVFPQPPPLSLSGIPRQGFLHGSTGWRKPPFSCFPLSHKAQYSHPFPGLGLLQGLASPTILGIGSELFCENATCTYVRSCRLG